MKIAPPQRQGVQSMGRHSVGNTGLEGDVEVIKAITDVGSSLAFQSAEIINDRSIQKADLAAQEAQTQFNKSMSDQLFFQVNELPPDVVTEAMRARPDGRVMRAEVEPALYAKHMKASLGEISKSIALPGSRKNWETGAKIQGLQHLSVLQNRAQAEIKRQFFVDQTAEYKKAAALGQWGKAKLIAQGMYGTKEEVAARVLEAEQGIESKGYAAVKIADFNDVAVEGAIEFLSQPDEEYYESGGKLSPDQRINELHALNVYKTNNTKIDQAELNRQKAELSHRINTIESNTAAGKKTDTALLTQTYKDIEIMNGLTKNQFVGEQLKLEDLITTSLQNDQMILTPSDERMLFAKIRPWQVYPNDEVRRDAMEASLENSNKAMMLAENTDSMQAWSDAGFFDAEGGLLPVNFNDPGSIAKRMDQFKRGQQNYGAQLGQGPFTKQEALALGQELHKLPPKQKKAAILSTVVATGLESSIIFQQVAANDKEAAAYALAGVNIAYGNKFEGQTLLDGREYALANKELLTKAKTKEDVNAHIQTRLRNYSWDNADKKETTDEAVYYAYVGLKAASGDFDSFDDDAFDKALRIATGGTFKQGGFTLPNPVFGMEDDVMEDWIETTSWEQIQKDSGAPTIMVQGSPFQMNTQEFWDDFQNGDYGLKPGRDTLEYIVTDLNGKSLMGPGGGAYTIKYDPNPMKKPKVEVKLNPRSGSVTRESKAQEPTGDSTYIPRNRKR